MHWWINILFAWAATLIFTSSALAERVWTVRPVTLREEPNGLAPSVVRVKRNRALRIVDRDGRWLRVRYRGKTGWVAQVNVRRRRGNKSVESSPERSRSAVLIDVSGGDSGNDMDIDRRVESGDRDDSDERSDGDDRELASHQHRAASADTSVEDHGTDGEGRDGRLCTRSSWCGKISRGGMRLVVDTELVQAFERPGAGEKVVFTVEKNQQLTVMGRNKSGWFLVEAPGGKVGWIHTSAVRDKGKFVRAITPADQLTRKEARSAAKEPRTSKKRGRFLAKVSIGIGFAATGSNLRGSAAESGYLATAQSLAARVAGGASFRVAGKLYMGIDAGYSVLTVGSGIRYKTASNEVSDIGFIGHRTQASAKLGYVSRHGAFVRVGYHFETLNLDNADNAAELPREQLQSPLVGIEFWLPELVGSLSAAICGELMLGTSIDQSEGKEDGAEVDSAWALGARLYVSYPVTSYLSLDAVYRYGLTRAKWNGTSNRDLAVTDASRTDQAHLVTVGMGAYF